MGLRIEHRHQLHLNRREANISIVKKFAVWRDEPACGQGRGSGAAAASDVV